MSLISNKGIETAERIVQIISGVMLLLSILSFLRSFSLKKTLYGIGGLMLLGKLARFTPFVGLLSLIGSKNILSQLKQFIPGYGISPALVQQAVPRKQTLAMNKAIPFSSANAIR